MWSFTSAPVRLHGVLFRDIKGKGKVVPVFLTEHHAIKAYRGVGVYIHAFLTSSLNGGEWSASRPGFRDVDNFIPSRSFTVC